ncbi:arylsulfatase [Prevotella sp. DNF00663]|nr:alkaline phosphatase family protein [Prevotella sp. DNF00663]KXB80904.1 arylsulfatase [Prevotella sp. DNF00663]
MREHRLKCAMGMATFILGNFIGFAVLAMLMKPFFMLYNHAIYVEATLKDYVAVMWHGLPMDFSVSGYLSIVPALLALVAPFGGGDVLRRIAKTYYAVVALLLAMIFIVDAVLYSYWGFRLDTTPLFYFYSSPSDAMASVGAGFIVLGVVVWLLLSLGIYSIAVRCLLPLPTTTTKVRERIQTVVMTLVLMGLLIIPIRGGVTTSTMNLGNVYYSQNQRLNHAAVNPCFSLLRSWIDGATKLSDQYRLMDATEADSLFSQLVKTGDRSNKGEETQLLRVHRPNIVIVVLESFSAQIMQELGGLPRVAVNMDRLAREGVLFTRFYANSFRTDRGLVSILAGYPAQPTMSIMKYTEKVETLPSLPRELSNEGYDLQYYYGGDADFTNMRSFLTTAGFEKIVADVDFPVNLRLSKWGVPDGYVFDCAAKDIEQYRGKPFLKVIQTSSSHEPYDVPYHRLSNKVLNAFAYADDCLGKFVERLRRSKQWDNTLIVLVPDHLGCYPEDISNYDFARYHIPLIMVGGAVKESHRIDIIGSQIDIAATLLSQLGMPHHQFTFSKDMMDSRAPHFGYFTVPNALGMITSTDSVMYDLDTKTTVQKRGKHTDYTLKLGKAYLQKLYDDLSKR